MHLETIRLEVRRRLAELGAAEDALLSETCLLQNSAYCGRRFMLDGYQAVWFLEENQLKFYGPSGELIGGTELGQAPRPVATRAKAA